ncbi:MAG TPA: protein kinase, partial [Pirellulales bacterium]
IHRDIKPANVWLEGASGWVKLVDFGLAHAAEDVHLTQTGAILGTPAYMSPEQARGETVDGRTDLYSLGAVLYKLTTGEVPFRGASTMAVLMALATETPRPPVELNPGIPPALNDLILRLLAKKPDDRYESAAAVAEAIRQIETSRVGIAHHEPEGEPSADVPVRRRPRWPLVAAAAAAAFLLAAIVIIVRDKDGKEVFRATVPDSGSVTLTEGNAAAKATPPLDDGSAIPPPADITEPPPLEEWLKGRTVLTVAQDGSGKFKTIQSALDALQAGQVVKVLDRGPYREQLNARVLPADTGLVSEVSAVIELPEYRLENKGSPSELEVGHFFREMDGFHLAGFKLVFPGQEHFRRCGLYTVRCEGLVLEHCWLHGLRGALQARVTGHAGDGDKPVCIRECLIEGALDVGSVDNEQAAILVARNLFVGPDGANAVQALLAIGKAAIYRYVGIRGNVFASPKDGLALHDPKHLGRLEITNNTFLGSNPISWFYFDDNAVPAGQAIIANNLRLRPGLLALLLGSTPAAPDRLAQIHDAAGRSWHVAHNCYPRELRSGDSDYQASVVKFPGDILGAPRLISMAADNRDYLRPESGDSIATAGAGGELPSYIGALPPGPAPKEGDWFTRLRERWTDAGWASPTTESTVGNARPTIAEPPPLEEWLKGRAVLTVAQDGSGQFKTIQEAINALKPHQVVKVLDRGPYRESIRTAGLPDDTGLISDQQATVETLAWPEGGIAHLIGPVEKFRLAGIRFVAPRRDSWGAIVLWAEPSGLVIEDCCFALAVAQHPTQSVAALYFAPEIEAPDKSPIVVHNCLFEFALLEIAGGVRSHPTFIVERNYFRKSGVGLGRRLDQAVFRHNVFDGAKECFWIYELSDVTRALEISNNTAATGVSVVHAAPPRGVLLRNNITEHDVAVDGEVYKFRAEIVKNWQRDHSSYLRRSLLAKSPTDVTVEPAYLSSDPADRNYLRIPADGPQAVGGAGGDLPSYMGALPPGPAPKEGDWFTRLQARWTTGGQASSAVESEVGDARPTIAEPPPLEEWLKGRTVLTVAQDGSGQFKTIQAALDALKAHQVVEVLDAGPYRETLRCFGLPLDTALVSRRQTTIEMPDEQGEPHYLHQSDGFRLSGFRFFSSPRQQWSWPCLVTCGAVTNLAVEDCHFVWKAPRDPRTKPAAVHIAEAAGARPSAASVVRHCVFDSASLALAGNADGNSKGSLRVEHNYFRNTYIFRAGKSLYQLLIRHNAIEAGTIEITELEDVTGILEISNNTVTGSDWSFNIRGAAPKRGLIIRN